MRRSREIRFGAALAVAGLAAGTGCTHHHYYTGSAMPTAVVPCDPATGGVGYRAVPAGSAPIVGEACDDPPQAALVARNGAKTTPMVSNAARPVNPAPIYSRPAGRGFRGGSGLAWRSSGTESVATTNIEGAYEEDKAVK